MQKILVDSNINTITRSFHLEHRKTISQIFEEQVERTPDNTALVYENKQLTYKELNERANKLAYYIRELCNIKPDTLICLYLHRSEQMIIAILAVLKAGGAYVPIDPIYPNERTSCILEDTSAKLLLTNEIHKQKLQTLVIQTNLAVKIISLDSGIIKNQLLLKQTKNFRTDTTSSNLAYVIYTSGTTGKPNGVLQLHSNVVRLFSTTNLWYKFNQNDIWVLYHSYVFDFSIWEIWGALMYGSKLIIPKYDQVRDLNIFYNLCKKENVTILNQTPTAFYQFISIAIIKAIDNKLDSLKYIIFGGEKLNLAKLKPWFNCYGYSKPQLINMYGITETTVHVTYKPINKSDSEEKSYIGQVIPDLKIYILDSNLNTVPTNVIGELYVGGAGLARGYLNRPDLTSERFIPNPFQTEKEKRFNKNTRLYKTGDLVRQFSDGNLEYIGRNDSQVKIRGYRIELQEIENVLSMFDKIKHSVVLVKEHIDTTDRLNDDKYLVGYYVSMHKLNEIDIINFLKEKLPDYMIPRHFIHLNKLPLTINGKLDHKALLEYKIGVIKESCISSDQTNEYEKLLSSIFGIRF